MHIRNVKRNRGMESRTFVRIHSPIITNNKRTLNFLFEYPLCLVRTHSFDVFDSTDHENSILRTKGQTMDARAERSRFSERKMKTPLPRMIQPKNNKSTRHKSWSRSCVASFYGGFDANRNGWQCFVRSLPRFP